MLTSAWKDWYHAQHERRCIRSGTEFEGYVTAALALYHPDFFNPEPAGSLGDGGCDGLAESGSIAYACYGSVAQKDAERKLQEKIQSDFERATTSWPDFTTWRFVTNASAGPLVGKYLISIQKQHEPGTARPLAIHFWTPARLWTDVVSKLDAYQFNELIPGAPGLANLELEDLVPLLDALGAGAPAVESSDDIRPVPVTKMDFNELSPVSRQEFNAGRLMSPRIDGWFDDASDPDLRDTMGQQFRSVYVEQIAVTKDPTEVLERLYNAIGGPDIRRDTKRANAVYAITAYFFDLCHIFEEPPVDWVGGEPNAAAN